MAIRVLFVCLGNICRSPMAEAVFQQLVDDTGLSSAIMVDSAGTSDYHIGEAAHPGTRRVLSKHGIDYIGSARQVAAADVADAHTYIIAMDQDNVNELRRRYGNLPRLHRLLEFATHTTVRDVPDPYYSNNFDHVYRLVEDGCLGLLRKIRTDHQL